MDRTETAWDLASAYRELGDLEEQEVLAKAALFRELAYMGITERTATVNHQNAGLTGAILKLRGEIRALELELRLLET